jgi:hypothetical protein
MCGPAIDALMILHVPASFGFSAGNLPLQATSSSLTDLAKLRLCQALAGNVNVGIAIGAFVAKRYFDGMCITVAQCEGETILHLYNSRLRWCSSTGAFA